MTIPMLLWCPECGERHIDAGEFSIRPHHTHACQTCGHVWRPAIVETVGVQFLPGFKDGAGPSVDEVAARIASEVAVQTKEVKCVKCNLPFQAFMLNNEGWCRACFDKEGAR